MKHLFEAIDELKKSRNIERYNFEEYKILYNDRWITGKILYLDTISTCYPKSFPFGQMERNLSYEIGRLRQMNWESVQIDKLGHRYIIKLIIRQVGSSIKISTFKTCSDCKDGYYYPLIGPRELCRTCTDYSKSDYVCH